MKMDGRALFAVSCVLCLFLAGCPKPGPAVEDLPKLTETWPVYYYGAEGNLSGSPHAEAVAVLDTGDILVRGALFGHFTDDWSPFLMRVSDAGVVESWLEDEDLWALKELTLLDEGGIASANILPAAGDFRNVALHHFTETGANVSTVDICADETYSYYAARATADGGALVGGIGPAADSSHALFLAKFAADGTLDWMRDLLEGAWERLTVYLDEMNGEYLCAVRNHEIRSLQVFRVDSGGTLLWTSDQLGAFLFVKNVRATADGGAVLAANEGGSLPVGDVLVKLDATGEVAWMRECENPGARIHQVAPLPQGGLVLWTAQEWWGLQKYVEILRLDSSGEEVWRYALPERYSPERMALTPAGGCILVGRYFPEPFASHETFPLFVLPLNASGEVPE